MMFLPERVQQPADDALVEIVSAQVIVAGGGQDFDGVAVDIQDADVEGTAAQVIDHDLAGHAFIKAVSQGG